MKSNWNSSERSATSAEPLSPAPTGEPAGWTGSSRLVLLLLLLAGAVSLIWLVHPYYTPTPDGARYIILAKSLLAGEGFNYLGEPFTVQMPGFSFVLVPLLALFGLDFYALNLFGSLAGLAGAALFFSYCRPRVGVPIAAASAAAVWLSPGFQTLCQVGLADVPGTVLPLGCLLLDRWARVRPFPRRDLVLGLAIAAACYVRNINALLIPAILLSRYLSWRMGPGRPTGLARFLGGRALLLVLVPLVLLLPWKLRNDHWRTLEPSTVTHDYSHWAAMAHTDRNDPTSPLVPASEIIGRIPTQLGGLTGFIGSRMGNVFSWRLEEDVMAHKIAGAVALLCLLFVLVRRRGAGEFLALGLTAVLAVYYTFHGRHALLVYLVAFAAVPDAILLALRGANIRRRAAWAMAGAIAVMAVVDFDSRTVRDTAASIHHRWRSVGDQIVAEYPSGGRFGADIGAGYAVFTGSEFYNLRFGRNQGLDGALDLLATARLEAVVAPPVFYRELFTHLIDRYGVENCATLSDTWAGHAVNKDGRRLLWLFRLDGPVDESHAACDPAYLVSGQPPPEPGPAVIVNVNVVPLDRPRVLAEQSVVVRDGRIERIGPVDQIPIPPDARRIDGGGHYLLPGFVDLWVRIESRRDLQLYLANGVTLVGEIQGSPAVLALRDAIEAGKELGPSLVVAGPAIGAVGSATQIAGPTPTAGEMRQALDEQAEAGYDLLRHTMEFGAASEEALLAVAADHGPPVIAPLPGVIGLERLPGPPNRNWVSHLGQYPAGTVTKGEQRWAGRRDFDRMDTLARSLAQRGVFSVPGLVRLRNLLPSESRPQLLRQEVFGYVEPGRLYSWLEREPWQDTAFPVQKLNGHFQMLRALVGAGAPVVLGTGAGADFVVPGFSVEEELRLFVQAGMTPYQALRSATVTAGELLGRADELGPLAEGRRADLMLVARNPLEGLGGATRPIGLMVRGQWFNRQRLAEMLRSARGSGAEE